MLPGLAGIAGFSGEAAAAPTDPDFANTILLLSGDGTDLAAGPFIDQSAAARGTGTNSGATFRTGVKAFGTASIYFDGYIRYIEWADHADWTLGTSDFTFETFWRPADATSVTTTQAIFSHYNATGNQRGWTLRYEGGAGTKVLTLYGSSDGTAVTTVASGAWTPTAAQWHYICVERSGNTFRLYTSAAGSGGAAPTGTASMLVKTTNAISFFNSTAPFRLSGEANTTIRMDGYIDEIRLTKNVARYNTDAGILIPTAVFPRS
jgi:hypothetical protein